MERKEIIGRIKELGECGIIDAYLYDVLTDGSSYSEEWLNHLEDADLKTENDLIGELETMFTTLAR